MGPALVTGVNAADAGAIAELIAALEASLHGRSAFSEADLVQEWLEVDLERNALVVRAGERIVGYGALRERGDRRDAEGYVHPDWLGRGIGKLIATRLELVAARQRAARIQSRVFEVDSAGARLLESLGYGAVRLFREVRIVLDTPPAAPRWPAGLRVVAFDPTRDAREFHAAEEEAFRDHWEYTPRDFESWSKAVMSSERFDPTLCCVVRASAEIAAGAICTADSYGGGWIDVLFTRRPWRRTGVATALLRESFRRFWERGERSIGLGVDTANPTGAFRLYESVGMASTLGLLIYEKQLSSTPAPHHRSSSTVV